ncbi:hypothetical protein JKP88DRAFT_250983 [Tribonema minus]|uniref:Uncharacterized protein n=1 Tax=Tribonema minus TaxID=303371 RepID=A0A835ZFM1_9STRA|nr:hypothetical protein JKP88DRAFT_250983 [Tribonema minus]
MDPTVKAVADAFADVDAVNREVKATIYTGDRGIERTAFERLHERFATGIGWEKADAEWVRKVTYTMKDGSRLSYIVEGAVRSYRHDVLRVVAVASEGVVAVVRRSAKTDVVPPPKETRYKSVRVDMIRRFYRASGGVPGVSWCFELAVRWHAVCVRDLETAPPRYLVSVVMSRVWSNPQAAMQTDASRAWLAESLLLKLKDSVVQAGLREDAKWVLGGEATQAKVDDMFADIEVGEEGEEDE